MKKEKNQSGIQENKNARSKMEETNSKRKSNFLNFNFYRREEDSRNMTAAEWAQVQKEQSRTIFIVIMAVFGVIAASFFYVLFFSILMSLFELPAHVWDELFRPGGYGNANNSSIVWYLNQNGYGVEFFVNVLLVIVFVILTLGIILAFAQVTQLVILLVKGLLGVAKRAAIDIAESVVDQSSNATEMRIIAPDDLPKKNQGRTDNLKTNKKKEPLAAEEKTVAELIEEKKQKRPQDLNSKEATYEAQPKYDIADLPLEKAKKEEVLEPTNKENSVNLFD